MRYAVAEVPPVLVQSMACPTCGFLVTAMSPEACRAAAADHAQFCEVQ